jgi:hypothetical protein
VIGRNQSMHDIKLGNFLLKSDIKSLESMKMGSYQGVLMKFVTEKGLPDFKAQRQ